MTRANTAGMKIDKQETMRGVFGNMAIVEDDVQEGRASPAQGKLVLESTDGVPMSTGSNAA